MKNYLKNLGLLASVLVELVGLLAVLMQYKILSKDIVILVSAIVVGVLITFGLTTLIRTLAHNVCEEKQPARSHQKINVGVIIFWVFLISSLAMMIITNVLAFAGFSYKSAGVRCSWVIWCICVVGFGIMYLFDIVIINDNERLRKESVNRMVEEILLKVYDVEEDGI